MESKHHPNGGASAHCDNGQIESLIAQYQANRDIGVLSSIVGLTEPRALTLIRFYKTSRYKPKDELLSDINFKLIKAVDKFDPAKGTAFTFVSQVIANVLFTSVSNARKDSLRYRELTKRVLSRLVDVPEDRAAVDDINHKIKAGARTTLDDKLELSVQRWYIESFTDGRFESRRHECANAAMVLYPVLSHARSRELYDLTMLEVRRVLYDSRTPRQEIVAGRLFGTRLAWMARYAPLMSAAEFTKFATLMRDLAPYLLLLIDRENRNRRADRSPAVSRKNIELILFGDPDAVPLFGSSISVDKGAIPIDSNPL
jgi:hypothetical protein